MVELVSREAFLALVDRVLKSSKASDTVLSLSDRSGGLTRFANNQFTQNVSARRQDVRISVAFGRQTGSASTTDISEAAVLDALTRACEIAKLAPEDPEYLPPLPAQQYPVLPTWRADTAAAGPERRIETAGRVIEQCRAAGVEAAGTVSSYATAVGVASSSGLRAYERRTDAQFSLTATEGEASGWAQNSNRSFDDLRVDELTQVALEKVRAGRSPRELPAGRYTVLLEPAAVAGLVGPLLFGLDARSYFRGTSALAGRLGERVIDERLSLQNRPDHPQLLGNGFDGSGLPSNSQTWIERGVLRELNYDRFTAHEKGAKPSYGLDAPRLAGEPRPIPGPGDVAKPGEGEVGETLADLIAATPKGILVTNFWYIREVNAQDLTYTGMTRDGTFLIEDGRIAGGLINFRWHDSPLRALNALQAYTAPLDAITHERPKMLLPAMRIGEFNFSSVTKF